MDTRKARISRSFSKGFTTTVDDDEDRDEFEADINYHMTKRNSLDQQTKEEAEASLVTHMATQQTTKKKRPSAGDALSMKLNVLDDLLSKLPARRRSSAMSTSSDRRRSSALSVSGERRRSSAIIRALISTASNTKTKKTVMLPASPSKVAPHKQARDPLANAENHLPEVQGAEPMQKMGFMQRFTRKARNK